MRDFKRLFYMLLLNVIVSLAVILTVLYFWQRTRNTALLLSEGLADAAVTAFATFTPQPTQTPLVTPTQAVLSTSTLPPAPQAPPGPTATIRSETYQVKAGDTLGTIANQFQVSVNDLIVLNALRDPDTLSIGQELLIPLEPLPPSEPQPTDTKQPASPTNTPRPLSATSTPNGSDTPQAVPPQNSNHRCGWHW